MLNNEYKNIKKLISGFRKIDNEHFTNILIKFIKGYKFLIKLLLVNHVDICFHLFRIYYFKEFGLIKGAYLKRILFCDYPM